MRRALLAGALALLSSVALAAPPFSAPAPVDLTARGAAANAQAGADASVKSAGGDASAVRTLALGATNSLIGSTRAGNMVSVLEFAPAGTTQATLCNGTTNVAPQVNAAKAAGYRKIFIPAGCLYKPDGNTTPANVEVIGEDWKTTVISVANRATDHLYLGPHSILRDMAVVSTFCDGSVYPANTQKECPVGEARNTSDSPTELTNWIYEPFFLTSGPTSSDPNGVQTIDTPIIAIEQSGSGSDGLYVSSGGIAGPNGNTSAIRAVTAGQDDIGIFGLNGFYGSSAYRHNFMKIQESSDNSHNSASIYIDRAPPSGQDVAPSLVINDADTTTSINTSPLIDLVTGHQSGGSLVNVYQAGNQFGGDMIHANMGNSGGTFSGNFEQYTVAGKPVFTVAASGQLTKSGGITESGPSSFAALTVNGALNANGGINVSGGGTISGFVNLQGGGFLGGGSANYLNWGGVGSGGSPYFVAAGSDANIDLTLGGKGSGGVKLTGLLRLAPYTVATLPTCNAAEQDAMVVVTDATSPTYRGALTGGGSVRTPVYCDGSSWTAH